MDPKILELTREDPRYAYEAYEFVCEAVTYTQERLGRGSPGAEEEPDADHHVSGGELLRGACELAVREFGMMAPVVFRQWGVRTTFCREEKAWKFFDFWTTGEACFRAAPMTTTHLNSASNRLSLHRLSPAEGFVAAGAVAGARSRLALWDWQ